MRSARQENRKEPGHEYDPHTPLQGYAFIRPNSLYVH